MLLFIVYCWMLVFTLYECGACVGVDGGVR